MLKTYKNHQVLYSFAKTSIVFLLIMLIIVNCFNALALSRANQTYDTSMSVNISNAINAYEDMLYNYKQSCLQFSRSGYLLKLAGMTTKLYNYSFYDASTNLHNNIQALKQSHAEFVDMYLIFDKIDYAINTMGTWQIVNIDNQLRQYNLDIDRIKHDSALRYDVTGDYLRLLYDVKNCEIVIILSKSKISDLLRKYISSQDAFLYIYSSDTGALIASNDYSVQLQEGAEKKYPRSSIFSYYYKYNNMSYGMRLNGIIVNSLMLSVIILAILAVYILILKKKLYNPLDHILGKLKPGYNYLGEMNEYSLLETSFDELNKRLSQYQTAFSNVNTELEQNAFNRLLSKNDFNCELLQNIYCDQVQPFSIFAISMIIEDNLGYKNSDAVQTLLHIISEKYKTIVIFDTNKYTSFFLLYSQTDGDYDDIAAFIGELVNDIKKSAFIIMGISRPYNGIEMLKQAYGESLSAMRLIPMDVLETTVSVQLYKDIPQSDESFVISINDCNKLINAATALKKDDAASILNNIVQNNRHISLAQMRKLLFYIEDTIFMSRNRQSAEGSEAGLDPYKYINGIYNVKILYSRITASLNHCAETQPALDDQINRIVKYIEDHLSEDISLYDLAGEMGMSYAYLSQFIKKKMGESFVQYVQDMRIKKSEQLLQDTDLEIIDITKLAGFNTKNTFYRIFKERNGITPGEYRKAVKRLIV